MFNWTYFLLWVGAGAIGSVLSVGSQLIANVIWVITIGVLIFWWSQFGFGWAALALAEFLGGALAASIAMMSMND